MQTEYYEEAADTHLALKNLRITALQAENEKLREALLAHKEVAKDYAADALRLREALEYIAETSDDQHISRKAFETLEPKP